MIIMYIFAFCTCSKMKLNSCNSFTDYCNKDADGEFTQTMTKGRALVRSVVSAWLPQLPEHR